MQYRWVILSLVFLTYMVNFADRVNIGIVLPVLREDLLLTNLAAGSLVSAFYLGYGISQLPAGLWISKYGTRTLGCVALVGLSTFTYLIGLANSANIVRFLRFALGVFEGPIPVGSATVIKNWYPRNEQAIATGFFSAAGVCGQIVVPPLAVWIMLEYGWRTVFYWFAVPGFLLALLWYLLAHNCPEESPYCQLQELEYISQQAVATLTEKTGVEAHNLLTRTIDMVIKRRSVSVISQKRLVFSSKNIIGITLAFFFIGFVSLGMLAWLPAYLVDAKGYSLTTMGWVAASQPLGGLLGCICGGYISDRWLYRRRKPNLLLTPLAMLVMMYALMNVPQNTSLLSGFLFLTGFFLYLAWSCYFAYPMLITTGETYPVAIALMTSVGNLGGFFSPMAAGFLLDTYNNYNAVFLFFAFCAFASFVSACIIDEPLEE